jgi:hypothetical protein
MGINNKNYNIYRNLQKYKHSYIKYKNYRKLTLNVNNNLQITRKKLLKMTKKQVLNSNVWHVKQHYKKSTWILTIFLAKHVFK